MRLGGFMIAAENCGKVAERAQSPMCSRSSHSRKSPLKPMLSAVWRPEDDAWLDLLARLDCSFAGFADTTFKIEVSVYLHYYPKVEMVSLFVAMACAPTFAGRRA